MDPKELRGLMEAYSEVYVPVDEGYMSPEKKIKPSPTRGGRPVGDMRKPVTDKTVATMQLKKNESVDFYDIVLSYLLDEGYAETPEAAEAIMVNMSEEWIGSIVG